MDNGDTDKLKRMVSGIAGIAMQRKADQDKDASPKLSEQGLLFYKAIFDHINLMKKHQWTITNYAALLYGAIFVFAKELSKLSFFEKSSLGVATFVVWCVGTLLLSYTQSDLSGARTRLDKVTKELFTSEKERNILGLEKETEPLFRDLEFTLPLLGVMWIGAAMLMYYLIVKT